MLTEKDGDGDGGTDPSMCLRKLEQAISETITGGTTFHQKISPTEQPVSNERKNKIRLETPW